MRKYQLPALVICMCLLCFQMAIAQGSKLSADSIIDLPSSYYNKIQHTYADLDDRLTKKQKNT